MTDSSWRIETNLKQVISSDQANHYRIIPDHIDHETIVFKTDQTNKDLERELSVVLNQPIRLIDEDSTTVDKFLSVNYRQASDNAIKQFHFNDDFVEKIIQSARSLESSDIHLEPYENRCRIRFRIDGKLNEQYIVDVKEFPIIINKLKIRAGLDISEKRLPQDGRITMKLYSNEFDIRVSSLPTLYGEKMVLRILKKDVDDVSIDSLGFGENQLVLYKEAIRKPNGIVLISGPTGSGKTTTLYATLKLLNTGQNNILTIEDPIEYTLAGVNQVQLKENIGLDFSSTMRTFLRQDPDIIMVGEIRDRETANMAIRAALTGHLVLSTIHTNDSWATISRLIDMGVPAFLIASVLNISVAQRLVRKLCPYCCRKMPIEANLFPKSFEIPKDLIIHYTAQGCDRCHHTGYTGRQALYEVLAVSKELTEKIKLNELNILQYLEKNSIPTLKENAVRLIKNGVTSIEEAYPLLID
ncbi:GspE/PulE family protein [Nonlabens agnitus]|uniref:General secretion pathway protein GspE n=1 Tax=Nonlabens agnitus TaxID=870484 RepID=A0A2S9WQW6_9FLAO|nr:GspE/PulE family protein [Nonlabens agnitus]PRP65885.1 general secretion pathway protein GspE [Nonlabens agnitus]